MKFNELARSFFRKMVQIRSNFATMCTIKGTRGAKLPIDATFSESLEKSLDKVVSREEKNFSVHKKYMNFFQYRKTALDEHLYKLSAGRSMVEMLGVLAIIGVLSVGAISGYSKAMMKYKLNKQAEQVSTIINNILFEASRINKTDKSALTKDTLIKLGAIPVEMIDNKNVIYDAFHNKVSDASCDASYCVVHVYFTNNQQCINLINIAKNYSDKLYYLSIWSTNPEYKSQTIYGDNDCFKQKDYGCFRNLTLDELQRYCNSIHTGNQDSKYIYFANYAFSNKLL